MVRSSSFQLTLVLSTFHSGTRKLKKSVPQQKGVAAKQASGKLVLERGCHFVFTATITTLFGKIARGQVKVLENVDNVERRINAGENVSELSRKTFVNITSH